MSAPGGRVPLALAALLLLAAIAGIVAQRRAEDGGDAPPAAPAGPAAATPEPVPPDAAPRAAAGPAPAAAPAPTPAAERPLPPADSLAGYELLLEQTLRPWREKTVTVTLEDLTLEELILRLRSEFGLALLVGPIPAAESIRISCNFSDTSADQMLQFVREVTQLDIVADGSGRIWLSEGKHAESIAAPGWADAAAAERVREQILADATPVVEPAALTALRGKIEEARVTHRAAGEKLIEVLRAAARPAGIAVMADYGDPAVPDASIVPVDLDATDRPLAEVLDTLTAAAGLAWYAEPNWVFVTTRERAEAGRTRWAREEQARQERLAAEATLLARPVRVAGRALAAADVAAALGAQLGVRAVADLATWRLAETFDLPDRTRPAAEIVAALRENGKVLVGYREGVLWLLSPAR